MELNVYMRTDSILTNVKEVLIGGEPEELEKYTPFDTQLLMYINSAINSLVQLGLESANGVVVKSKDQTWTEVLGERDDIEFVKEYITLSTLVLFDPPDRSYHLAAIENRITELTFRINVQVDYSDKCGALEMIKLMQGVKDGDED